MKAEEFNEIVESQCKSIKDTLLKKAGEYATEGDRFHNFNVGSVELGLSRLKYAESLMQKHITSVRDMINQWEEKRFRYCKYSQITPTNDNKYVMLIGDKIMYLGLSRWHYQQRRVRVRREKHQKRIDQMLRAHPYGKVVSIKERGRKVIGVLLNEYTK